MRPKVVIAGTFHRDHAGLTQIFTELERLGCRILYPISIDFLDTTEAVVHTEHDQDISVYDLEFIGLRAIRDVDFIFLHAPNGYVGLSGAFEIGYATAYGKPIFATALPNDEMLASQTTIVGSPAEALNLLQLPTL
ncbi:MAG TPA: hypothetical protein VLE99_00825 [Candidatus Saccharimonadales bacterium]|nr:hypothetical protein [Candidatus Saccharimonadales bacterium]